MTLNQRLISLLGTLQCFPLPDYVISGLEKSVLETYLQKTVTRQLVMDLIAGGPKAVSEGATETSPKKKGKPSQQKKQTLALLQEIGCFPVPDHVMLGVEAAVESGFDSYVKETVSLKLVGKILVAGPAAGAPPASPAEGASSSSDKSSGSAGKSKK